MNNATAWPTLDEARAFLKQGTGREIKIAVLDSGVEESHPMLGDFELADDLAVSDQGLSIATVPGECQDVFGHGTAIASILHRVAPQARLGSFRVLGPELSSRSLVIREGARLALERGYHILNCSFGCAREDQVLLYKDWIDEAYAQGRHVVASCNNQDYLKREWPGYFTSVLTVAAVSCDREDALFYRRGDVVEFAAGGQNVEVAWAGGGRKRVSGSSFAAPRVAGLLARLLSCCPALSPSHAKALLQQLAEPWH